MTPGKRLFDICGALFLALVLWPLIVFVAWTVWRNDGRPVLHVSERMNTPDRAFGLVKFRTMRTDPADAGVSGGDKAARITPTGARLRRRRLDELPQLWNVLRGDISLVGPRPPLRVYVERFPDLYAEVLKARPGISGLATVIYHGHEERLLARCRTAAETDAVYARSCVPRKARLDRIYRDRRGFCFDWQIMLRTVWPRRFAISRTDGRPRSRPSGGR